MPGFCAQCRRETPFKAGMVRCFSSFLFDVQTHRVLTKSVRWQDPDDPPTPPDETPNLYCHDCRPSLRQIRVITEDRLAAAETLVCYASHVPRCADNEGLPPGVVRRHNLCILPPMPRSMSKPGARSSRC